ncbi:CPBP family intramembrane glutamic endopeptidase [Microcoleus sp. FACHB-672]|uniref:CPBP family intramembrane glutamic endopeptidase n=1 Tax=Microcoleus sp. FACHB-672 TaxID=2692825 RepID=UPI001681DC95|nr:type II CAAX endopeptidase family protein [Microcoleus sp. FACHB-672]MBD2041323.1 CPBP family intramembrane metalloprotease [Microcoleus sp. FACHB-672]
MKLHPDRLAHYPAPARLGIFVLTLLCLWLPFCVPIYWLVSDQNLVNILTLVILYVEFIILVRLWGRYVYRQPHLLSNYGLERTRQNAIDLLKGLSTGILSQLGLFVLQGLLGWVVWQQPASVVFLRQVILEGLIVSLGIGFAEELLFRGWLLDELQRNYSLKVSLWVDAILFALLHFIKPLEAILKTWPTFVGLLVLGLTLVWAKRSRNGRLGLPIGLHAGLVWGFYIINVGQLVRSSGNVPEWVTGIDRNPLAGVMGVLCLGTLAVTMWTLSRKKTADEHR